MSGKRQKAPQIPVPAKNNNSPAPSPEKSGNGVLPYIDEIGDASKIIKLEQHFAGPLPRPDILKAYEDICPGAASTIIGWVTREQKGRIASALCGKIFALIYGLSVCGVAVYAIKTGHSGAGAVVMALNVSVVCVGFLAHRNKNTEQGDHTQTLNVITAPLTLV